MRADRCFTTVELAEYSVGKGSSAWRRRVEEHLIACSLCGAEMAAFGRVDELLKQSTTALRAPDLWHAIAPRLAPRRRSWFDCVFAAPRRILAAATAVAAIVFVAVVLWQGSVRQSAPRADAVKLQHADTHATMTWSDPFADRITLAVLDWEIGEREVTE